MCSIIDNSTKGTNISFALFTSEWEQDVSTKKNRDVSANFSCQNVPYYLGFVFGFLQVGRVGGNRSKKRDRKSELVLRSTYQIFEWDRNNSDRSFYNVVRYVHIPLVP